MAKIPPKLVAKFRDYVADAAHTAENLAFLIDNLDEAFDLDFSILSLERAEAVYWRHLRIGIPADLSDSQQFANLLGQYLGQCIIHHTGAKWVQCKDNNLLFGQPCIDGFGGRPWDRVYPVNLANHLAELPQTHPFFPGVRKQRVCAAKLEAALKVFQKNADASS